MMMMMMMMMRMMMMMMMMMKILVIATQTREDGDSGTDLADAVVLETVSDEVTDTPEMIETTPMPQLSSVASEPQLKAGSSCKIEEGREGRREKPQCSVVTVPIVA